MSYLKFDKSLLSNLEESLTKELLRTNKSGAYQCTTIVGCNTRKYHGLLTIPMREFGGENHVLLSSFDETVVQHGSEFNLGLHKYQGDNFSPKGHKYMREFNCEVIPSVIYRVGGVLLKKETVFTSYENRILIKYTLLDAHSQTTLRFRPFLAFRSVNDLCVENNVANTTYSEVQYGISMCMYKGYPNLYMQFNKNVDFISQPYWNKNIEYPKEQERGYAYKEDLFVPGYFEVPIEKGETLIFSAGVSEIDTDKLLSLFKDEISLRTPRTSFYNCLKNSAEQHLNKKSNGDLYVLAGYPWFKSRARDTFISLPGMSLAIDKYDIFDKVMDTMSKALRDYMNNGVLSEDIEGISDPDVLLWCTFALQEYAKVVGDDKMWKKYGSLFIEILEFIKNNKHNNLFLHDNGLLYSNGWDTPITWMNSVHYGRPITPRSGYIVEFNALWFNAISYFVNLKSQSENSNLSEEYYKLVEKVKGSFVDKFWNGVYLYDFVTENYREFSVRPNMIFAVSLSFSPLDSHQRKSVLDITTKELLTPKGLRSLSPKSQNYCGSCEGNQGYRDHASYQGTAWPWLMGAYIDAYLKVYKRSGYSFAQRAMIGFEEELYLNCVGTISEMFDANPPFKGRGGISYAMNVAELLRVLSVLKKFEE